MGAGLVLGLALLFTACGGGPSPQPDSTPGTLPSTSSPPGSVAATTALDPNATLSLGLPGEPANWNPLLAPAAAGGADPALAVVAASVLPSAVLPSASASSPGAGLVTAATVTSARPFTVVYELDPRATWSDGVAITGADFVYTWETQSGQDRFRDRAGAAFTPASTAGYRLISSVASTAADPDRVVVRFASPDPDWSALFDPILPAHIARVIGFDHGFTDPVTSLVSGGPFLVQSYQPGDDVVLVRNPRWWGPAAGLATLDVVFVDSAPEAAQSLRQGQLDAAVIPFSPAVVATLRATAGLEVSVGNQARFDDLVFDERSGPFSLRAFRRAVMAAVDRPAAARVAVAAGDGAAAPVDDRVFSAGARGYRHQAAALGALAAVEPDRMLAAAGYRRQGSTLTRDGRAVRLTLRVATTSPLAASEVAAIEAGCRTLGLAVTITAPPSRAVGARIGAGAGVMTLVEAPLIASPAALTAAYGTGGMANRAGYSSTVMDGLLAQLASAPPGAENQEIADQVDALAWSDAVDLPMLAVPQVLSHQDRYAHLQLAPSVSGLRDDEGEWGLPQSA